MIDACSAIRQSVRLWPVLAAWVAATVPLMAAADDYPVRPVRIVTSEAGGGNDVQARLIARGLSGVLGQQVIVENRPSGVITPRPLIDRLNREIVRLLETGDVRERFLALGMETKGGPPAQLAATIASEIARMGKVIRKAGISASQ